MRIKHSKGFTLIELLLTIALLSVISIISFVSITSIINKNKDNECASVVNNIILAAKEYYSDKRYDLTSTITGDSVTITAASLISNNYLNGNITNPYTKTAVTSGNVKIIIYLYNDKTIKDIKVTEADEVTAIFNNCKTSSKNIKSGIKVTKPANKAYQINYILYGGTLGTNAPKSGLYNSNVIINNPTKKLTITLVTSGTNTEGATFSATSIDPKSASFLGWSSSVTKLGLGSNAKTGTNSKPTTAWGGEKTKNAYFKNLRDNSGTVTLVANWDSITIKLPTITKSGYTCGWNTKQNSTTIEYASGANYVFANNSSKTTVKLYAYCK